MEKTPCNKLVIAGMVILLGLSALAMAQTAKIPSHAEPHFWNSAVHNGEKGFSAKTILAESHRVEASGAPWLRLRFKEANLGEKSYITITSLEDGATQRLDAISLAQWQNTSAYFNGGAVEVQLHAGPEDQGIYLNIEKIVVGEWVSQSGEPESQCGPTDDRVPSNNPAAGRLLTVGCTGWIVSTNANLHVTAGHCSGGNATLQFNVPLSNSNGTINHPPPEDQYSVDPGSWNFVNGGIGNDWGVFQVFPNSITGLLPSQAQGASFNVVQNLGPPTIRITGYGVDSNDPTLNQTQQTHAGPNAGSSGTTMRYQTDTEGGNSGSPVIDEATGTAVGVHTHGGCTTGGGGNNSGTSTFNTAFWAALNPSGGGNEFRINSGGPNYTSVGGDLFVADRAFTPGSFGYIGGSPASTNKAIANTNDDPLYQDMRRTKGSTTSFSYDFDGLTAGTYSVTLHLVAPSGGPGDYIMDVSAEGVIVFNDLNINSEAGGTNTALIKTFSQSVTDGRLDLDFTKVNNAALVCGIEVVQTAAPSLTEKTALNAPLAASVPQDFRLSQNHPNPFNPSTLIRYQISRDMQVTLRVYNLVGEEVRTLANRYHHAGSYIVEWDGRLNSGARAASGVYLYRLEGEGFTEVRKMVLMQ